MGKEIMDLAPQSLWKHFYEFTQIPRPSHHEAAVVKYIEDVAKANNLSYVIDEVGNIIVTKPASKGKESSPGIILQSHVDMVPQKNSSKVHIFETDPIETVIDGDWVTANETTLGADNGIGCAAMLAVLEAKDISHGPIEALFTINEEAGMEGAFGLKSGVLKGQVLLNLDSEDEGELFVGCAGGINVEAKTAYKVEEVEKGSAFEIVLSGLKGGHSGLDINLGRGNANKILGRLLWSAINNLPLSLSSFKGGDLRNAIPREASAIVVVPSEIENDLMSFIEHFENSVKDELKVTEPHFNIQMNKVELPETIVDEEEAERLIGMINAAPNGVKRMSDDMPGIVESSLNLAIITIDSEVAEFFYLIRSSVDSSKYAIAEQVAALHKITGCELTYSGDYPGWKPNPESKVVKISSDTYKELFDKEPGLLAIHAGLECGIIGGSYSNLDMISFGPTICFPHSPDEKILIPTVDKFYTYLLEVLKRID